MPSWDEIKAGIFAGESGGDYNALFGFSNRPGGRFAGTNLTDMSVDDAIAFSHPGGPYAQWVKSQIGRVATPMGGFQIVGDTLKQAKKWAGLTGNEKMTPEIQDKLGQAILAKQGTGAWEGYRGPRTPGVTINSTPTAVADASTPAATPAVTTPAEPEKPKTFLEKLTGGAGDLLTSLQDKAKADAQAMASASEINPGSIGASDDSGRFAAAQQLMNQILMQRRSKFGVPGTTLTGLM